jgi:sortase A
MTTTVVRDEWGQAVTFPGQQVDQPAASWADSASGAMTGDERAHDRFGEIQGSISKPVVAGVALLTVAALLLGFLAYVFVFSSLTGARNQQRLSASLLGHPLTVSGLVAGHYPVEGGAIASLDIKALDLHQIVVYGTSPTDLMKGPGLMQGTVLPGTPGHAVIAGRRDTFSAPFGKLSTVKRGDKIKVIDGAGTFTYVVTHVGSVPSGHRDVVGPTAANLLTLVTSNPGLLASGRFEVVAQLKGSAATVDAVRGRIPLTNLALNGDSFAGWLTILWMLLTVSVVVAAAAAVMRWGQLWLIYLFAAPIVLMCGLFACEALARALPATF